MSTLPITYQATVLVQGKTIVDFHALTLTNSEEFKPLALDQELRARIGDALCQANTSAIIGLDEQADQFGAPHRDAAIDYLHITLKANVDNDLSVYNQAIALRDNLREGKESLIITEARRREYVAEPPVKPIGFQVFIGHKDGANPLSVELPALNTLEAGRLAKEFVLSNSADIKADDIFVLNSMPYNNKSADLENQGFPDHGEFANKTTADVFEYMKSQPDLLDGIRTLNNKGKESLAISDIQRRVNCVLAIPGGPLDICPPLDGKVHWQNLSEKLNELINGIEPTPASISDNRDALTSSSAEWFDYTPLQKAVLSHLSPRAEAAATAGVPWHLAESRTAKARIATIVMRDLAAGRKIDQNLVVPREDIYGPGADLNTVGMEKLGVEISMSLAKEKSAQQQTAKVTPEMSGMSM
jgi:hypothetical protein